MLRLLASVLDRKVQVMLGLVTGLVLLLPTASFASAGCPNEQFRIGLGANLPDCRAYEMVSPVDKNGGNVDGGLTVGTEPAPDQAALNGESVTYASQTAFTAANPQSGLATSQYFSVRGPQGWSTTGITPPQIIPYGKTDINFGTEQESLYGGFTEDLKHGFLVASEPNLTQNAPSGGFYNPYVRDDVTGAYKLQSAVVPPSYSPRIVPDCCETAFNVFYGGMSADGSHAIFAANDALAPDARPERTNLYESVEGNVELVSVKPNGETVAAGENPEYSPGAPSFGGSNSGYITWNFAHAISADGKRVFWEYAGKVYLHELTSSGPTSTEVSASQTPEGGEATSAHFDGASSDGSVVYFDSCDKLTSDSTAVPTNPCSKPEQSEKSGRDLYRYEVATGKLTDITIDPQAEKTAGFKGVLGFSDDGSYVYFAAYGALATGGLEEPGRYNMYVWHNGVTKFITSFTDFKQARNWEGGLGERTSRVSPNGRFVAFESSEPLTGYNNTPVNTETCKEPYWLELSQKGQACLEVFVYNASSERLTCASCNANGFPPNGNSTTPHSINFVTPYFGWQSNTVQQRYLGDDGRLFFDSSAALVPRDTNGKEDVYEYDPPGVGDCAGPKDCVSLISGGAGAYESDFIDADTSGNNVFFVTGDKLVSQDGDEQVDLYDARVGGGFSALSSPPCEGEACRPAVTPAPSIYGAPASQAFVGAGNEAIQVGARAKSKAKPKPKPRKHAKSKKGRHKVRKSGARSSGVRHGDEGGK